MASTNRPDLFTDAPAVQPPPNPVGPIAVANPARDLVQERNDEIEKDRASAAAKRARFEARKHVTVPSGSRDSIVESMILNTAVNNSYRAVTYPKVSSFTPCFSTPMAYLRFMDGLMASTKRWTDNCTGWVPPYSQIYIGILFYIQTFRAMESSGMLQPSSEILRILDDFQSQYSLKDVHIPGPLVLCFKSISCFWPTATGRFGNVSPAVPSRPGWSRERLYRLSDELSTHLPHIYLYASRLRSICAAATRANVTESAFTNDTDGPRFLATMFSQPCSHHANEVANLTSPGASQSYAGNLKLWQDAAHSLDDVGSPVLLDSNETNVDNSWTSFLGFDESLEWFGTLNAMMAKYCQFWKASLPLSECSPNGSAVGSVVCKEISGSLFRAPAWNEPSGTHNSAIHRNENQVGHYSLTQNTSLNFSASTTIEDIPEAHLHCASTYNLHLIPRAADKADFQEGRFWTIVPDAHELPRAQIMSGVLATISREYHCDSRVKSDIA